MKRRFLQVIYTLFLTLCPIAAFAGVGQVAAGGGHTLIVKTDGSLWACGNNMFGQLGDGTTTSRATLAKVMDGVASVATAYYHSLIVKNDGSLWVCGRNNYGQLGLGDTDNRESPTLGKMPIAFYLRNSIDYVLYANMMFGKSNIV